MAVTIRDVAREAGVSVKTVSRVINAEPTVRTDTRARVIASMDRLGYVPNVSAQRLARGSTEILGLIFPRDTGDFFNAFVHSIVQSGQDAGYEVLLRPANVDNALDRQEILGMATRRQVDGLVIMTPCDSNPTLLDDLDKRGCPFVRLFPQDRESERPFVTVDDFMGARLLTEHLISLGHRRIAFITGPGEHRSSQERLNGFQAALREHDIVGEPGLVRHGNFQFEDGYRVGCALLGERPMPTAIFASNDDMASGVIMAAHQLGILIPGELSVGGFDDGNLARQLWPPLTTVQQPTHAIAVSAVNLLVRLLKGQSIEVPHRILAPSLVVRNSTSIPRSEM